MLISAIEIPMLNFGKVKLAIYYVTHLNQFFYFQFQNLKQKLLFFPYKSCQDLRECTNRLQRKLCKILEEDLDIMVNF